MHDTVIHLEVDEVVSFGRFCPVFVFMLSLELWECSSDLFLSTRPHTRLEEKQRSCWYVTLPKEYVIAVDKAIKLSTVANGVPWVYLERE